MDLHIVLLLIVVFLIIFWKFNQFVDLGYWEIILENDVQGAAADMDKLRR